MLVADRRCAVVSIVLWRTIRARRGARRLRASSEIAVDTAPSGGLCAGDLQHGMGERLVVSGWLPGHARCLPVRSRQLGHARDHVPRPVVPGLQRVSLVRGGDGTVLLSIRAGGRAGVLHRNDRQLYRLLRSRRGAGNRNRRRRAQALSAGSPVGHGFVPRRFSLCRRPVHVPGSLVSVFAHGLDPP